MKTKNLNVDTIILSPERSATAAVAVKTEDIEIEFGEETGL